MEFTNRKQETQNLRQKVGELELTERKQVRTRFYRQKVGELEFKDRVDRRELQILQIESIGELTDIDIDMEFDRLSRRTGVYR